MKVKDEELIDYFSGLRRSLWQTTETRLLSMLKGRFYGRENPKQLLYRCEGLKLIERDNEQITVK